MNGANNSNRYIKMGGITVVNDSKDDIQVSVTATGGDFAKGGNEGWYTLEGRGGRDTWGSRDSWQVVRFVRSQDPGATVESVLGVPNTTVTIS